jgi:hypothetical protein
MSLVGRTLLIGNSEIALAEPVAGEVDLVNRLRDRTFDDDPDSRPVPFQVSK